MITNTPIVFISYSHDSPDHKAWVLRLASDLRAGGVDAILDQWRLKPGEDMAAFMEQSIAAAGRVLLICTEKYVERADSGAGGVGYERLVVTGELVRRIETKKFIPVVRQNNRSAKLPHFMGPRLYIDFSDDALYGGKLEELLRELHEWEKVPEPPIGSNPFAGTAPSATVAPRTISAAGSIETGRSVTEDAWFETQHGHAVKALGRTALTGFMNVRASLHSPISKSQIDLVNAVRSAQINTFGWPIGVLMENVESFRPQPRVDGIVAEIEIAERSISGSASYDYWYARTNGDYYMLQSLFEDQRDPHLIYFNTRIARVAESLLFLAKYYETLGMPSDARLTLGISHGGLRDRTLSAVGNRNVRARKTSVDASATSAAGSLLDLRESTAAYVAKLLEPMFMLFDFASFERSIYDDIVAKFKAGHVT